MSHRTFAIFLPMCFAPAAFAIVYLSGVLEHRPVTAIISQRAICQSAEDPPIWLEQGSTVVKLHDGRVPQDSSLPSDSPLNKIANITKVQVLEDTHVGAVCWVDSGTLRGGGI